MSIIQQLIGRHRARASHESDRLEQLLAKAAISDALNDAELAELDDLSSAARMSPADLEQDLIRRKRIRELDEILAQLPDLERERDAALGEWNKLQTHLERLVEPIKAKMKAASQCQDAAADKIARLQKFVMERKRLAEPPKPAVIMPLKSPDEILAKMNREEADRYYADKRRAAEERARSKKRSYTGGLIPVNTGGNTPEEAYQNSQKFQSLRDQLSDVDPPIRTIDNHRYHAEELANRVRPA